MLSQLLEDHYKVQEQLQQRRSARKALSSDAVIRECLKWNQEYPDAKVDFKILFPENFKAERIKPLDRICFIKELAQNQNQALRYPRVTPEQMVKFMQRNRHLEFNQRAVRMCGAELYEKKLDVACDDLMKKLLDWNKNSTTDKILFWMQTPLFWNHPYIDATNGKFVHVVDLQERKPSLEEQEHEFHLRFNSRINDLDFQYFTLYSETITDGDGPLDREHNKMMESDLFGNLVSMGPQMREKCNMTRFMFAHIKHLSVNPEDYTFDETGKQLVLKSPEEIDAAIKRLNKEKEFRERYVPIYNLEQKALQGHPMAQAFKTNSIALHFIRRKYTEEFGELFFIEERYDRFLWSGSPKVKPYERPSEAQFITVADVHNRKFSCSMNLGDSEILPTINETENDGAIDFLANNDYSSGKEHLDTQYSADNQLKQTSELKEAILTGDFTDVHSLTNELKLDKEAGLEEKQDKLGDDNKPDDQSELKPKKYKTISQQIWNETKQRKLVVIGKRRYSVKRQKNMKRIINDQGIVITQSSNHEAKANIRSRLEFKDTHLCRGRRSISCDSIFDIHGDLLDSESRLDYSTPKETKDDIFIARTQIIVGCAGTPYRRIKDKPTFGDSDIEIAMNDDTVSQKEVIEDSDIVIGKEIQNEKLIPKATCVTEDKTEKPSNMFEAFEITFLKKLKKRPKLSSSVKKYAAIENSSKKSVNLVSILKHSKKQVLQPAKKRVRFDIFDEPKKVKSKLMLSSNAQKPEAKEYTDEKTNIPVSISEHTEELTPQRVKKSVRLDIFDEPKNVKSKPRLSSTTKKPDVIVDTNEKTVELKQSKEQVTPHVRKADTFGVVDELKDITSKQTISQEKRPLSGKHIGTRKPQAELDQVSLENEKLAAVEDRGEVDENRDDNDTLESLFEENETKEDESTNEEDKVRKSRSEQRSSFKCGVKRRDILGRYRYSMLHNTVDMPCRIPISNCKDKSVLTSRNVKEREQKNLNVVKTKFRYSRLHRISRITTFLPDVWTKPKEMALKMKKREYSLRHEGFNSACSRLGRSKERETHAKIRKRSKVPVRSITVNQPKGSKSDNYEIRKSIKSVIPVRIKGYNFSSSEKEEDRANGNVNPVPCNFSPSSPKHLPLEKRSLTNFSVLQGNLQPLPVVSVLRRSPSLLERLPNTASRPASIGGYCVLPPIGKSRDVVKRPMSSGGQRKLLPPIEQIRPLSAYGYAKLPPIPSNK